MENPRHHARERDELARVDYFLDQLARAVERGEVPLASYDTLAPRYLARRADLVAVITGALPRAEPVGVPSPADLIVVPTSVGGTATARAASL